MAKLRIAILLALLSTFIFTTVEGKNKHLRARDAHEEDRHGQPCTNYPQLQPFLPPCTTSTPSTTTTTTTTTTASSTSTPTSLERAHWCRIANGSYLPLGYTYMQSKCVMCQCMTSHFLRCGPVECMASYCLDGAVPAAPSGQCCTQCPYEASNSTCAYNGATYQHGMVIQAIANKMQCWCQLGNIECRDYVGSLFDGVDIWGDGTTVYIIVIVIFIALLLGLCTCCGCTFFIYYYYAKHQQSFQQAYDEYVNSSGWQPVEEEQYPQDLAAQEKYLEAENGQYFVPTVEAVPPPYATVQNINTPVHEQQN